MGAVKSLDDFKTVSKLYVYEQIIKLVPILICIGLLVIVSTVSISALNVKHGLRTYSIYYICGSSRSKCLQICLINSILTIVLAFIFAATAMGAGKILGFLSKTIITISILGIAACTVVILIHIICSMIMPVTLMNKDSLKDNLSMNE